jgi:hypothetical protein
VERSDAERIFTQISDFIMHLCGMYCSVTERSLVKSPKDSLIAALCVV